MKPNTLTQKYFTALFLLIITQVICFSQEQFTYNHNGTERSYFLYIPEGIEDDAPLVFVLHGYTNSAAAIMSYCGMNDIADDEKFAVCYPQGTTDFLNIPHWNANLSVSTTDDIGFLTELANYLQTEYNLNPDHTFSCGMSNGGFMSYSLACERPDVFKAIASVTGTMSGYDWANCDPDEIIPIFQIHGFDDAVVPYDGNWNPPGGWGGSDGVESVRDFWIEKNQTTEITRVELHPNLLAEYYSGGLNNNQVWFYPITDWGHEWPTEGKMDRSGILGSEEIWQFFELVINNQSTSTSEVLSSNTLHYPNPFSEDVTINATDLEIYTIGGALIYKSNKLIKGETIDLSELDKGMYLFKSGNNIQKMTTF